MLKCARVSEGACGLQEENARVREMVFMRVSEIVGVVQVLM